MECVAACVKENNLDRRSNTQYIRIFEMEHGQMSPEVGDGKFFHEVPVEDRFYMGVQCYHCQNAPCVKACPTKATWQEPDGIVVVDYDWCIGCRYCIAACPYYGRRFNWNDPDVPKEEMTKKSVRLNKYNDAPVLRYILSPVGTLGLVSIASSWASVGIYPWDPSRVLDEPTNFKARLRESTALSLYSIGSKADLGTRA